MMDDSGGVMSGHLLLTATASDKCRVPHQIPSAVDTPASLLKMEVDDLHEICHYGQLAQHASLRFPQAPHAIEPHSGSPSRAYSSSSWPSSSSDNSSSTPMSCAASSVFAVHAQLTTAQTTEPSSCTNGSQVGIYRDLILRHLIQDIGATCTKLSLPANPWLWGVDECVRWIAEMCHQSQLPVPSRAHLLQQAPALQQMGGRWMMEMGVEDFCGCVPEGGDTLHAQLQLWKTALESTSLPVAAAAAVGFGQTSQRETVINYHPAVELSRAISSSSSHDCVAATALFQSQKSVQAGRHAMPLPCEPLDGGNFPSDSSTGTNHPESGESTDDDSSGSISTNPTNGSESSLCSAGSLFIENNPSLQSLFYATSSGGHHNHQPHLGNGSGSSDGGNHFWRRTNNAAAAIGRHYSPFGINGRTPGGGGAMEHQIKMEEDEEEEEEEEELAKGRIPHATLPHPNGTCSFSTSSSTTIHLWHFIRELLDQPNEYGSCVRWVNREEGTFKIESSRHLARFWGLRKNRSAMNYDKLSRSLRQYYKKGIIRKPEKKQRLVYKFLPPYHL